MDDIELKKELGIHPKSTIHQYSLWMPMDIYLQLYRIQQIHEEKREGTHMINDQIVEILKKHFENQKELKE